MEISGKIPQTARNLTKPFMDSYSMDLISNKDNYSSLFIAARVTRTREKNLSA